MADPQRFQAIVRNDSDGDVKLLLEPWGYEYKMASHQSFEVVVIGPAKGIPEIEYGTESITIWGWEGSEVSVEPLSPEVS